MNMAKCSGVTYCISTFLQKCCVSSLRRSGGIKRCHQTMKRDISWRFAIKETQQLLQHKRGLLKSWPQGKDGPHSNCLFLSPKAVFIQGNTNCLKVYTCKIFLYPRTCSHTKHQSPSYLWVNILDCWGATEVDNEISTNTPVAPMT